MDGEAWRAVTHGVAKSQTLLSDWTELNWMYITLVSIKFNLVQYERWKHILIPKPLKYGVFNK